MGIAVLDRGMHSSGSNDSSGLSTRPSGEHFSYHVVSKGPIRMHLDQCAHAVGIALTCVTVWQVLWFL